MTKDKVHVDEIFTQSEGKSTPVLLKFQNGDLKNAHKDSTLFFSATSKSDRKRKHAFVVTSGNVYSAPISDGSDELVDTYVCIRNKTTEKVRILPIDKVNLINHVYKDGTSNVGSMSSEKPHDDCMKLFGGRKALRYLSNRDRNFVNIDVFRNQLETTLENTEIALEENVVSANVALDRIRPKYNSEAKNLKSIFHIDDIIPSELMERLDEEVAVIMATDINDIPISSEFIKNWVIKLKTTPKSNDSLLKMKMILYMDALATLLLVKSKCINNVELSKITEKVENDIRDRFFEVTDKRLVKTQYTTEKALCYFLVLAFLVSEDCKLDLNVLSEELKLSKRHITKYANAIFGKAEAKSDILVLKLPSKIKQKYTYVMKGKK